MDKSAVAADCGYYAPGDCWEILHTKTTFQPTTAEKDPHSMAGQVNPRRTRSLLIQHTTTRTIASLPASISGAFVGSRLGWPL
jgi:hypothetical protein